MEPPSKTIPANVWSDLPHHELVGFGTEYRSSNQKDEFLRVHKEKIIECFGVASAQTLLWELGARDGDNFLKATHITGHIRYEDGTFETPMFVFGQSPYYDPNNDIEIMFKYECDVCKSRFNTMFCKVCPKLCDDSSPSQNSKRIVSGGGGFCMI